MKLNFLINDYILIWNILFQASISEPIYKLKQKLWFTYKEQYNNTYKDKITILKDVKNYIPNDDTIYNIVLESTEYEEILRLVEKYRLEVMKLWNKKVSNNLQKILKNDLEEYSIYLVDNRLDLLECPTISSQKLNVIILGKKLSEDDPSKLIISILKNILQKELNNYKGIDKLIADAIIEMAVENELATIITNNSHYWLGNDKLINIKRQIYPFWLMYLGVSKENMIKYMNRDKISFDIEKFPYEKKLKDADILQFINYCITKKRNIIREEQLDLI